jgi:hypothetical protein
MSMREYVGPRLVGDGVGTAHGGIDTLNRRARLATQVPRHWRVVGITKSITDLTVYVRAQHKNPYCMRISSVSQLFGYLV